MRLLPVVAPATLPRLDDVTLDGSVVLFCALATWLAALAPVLRRPHAVRGSISMRPSAARDGSSAAGFRGAHARRLRDGLLIVEAAFAVILIVGAEPARAQLRAADAVDNGYTAEGVLIASVELPRGATEARTDQFIDGALARLRATPRRVAAGAGAMIPLMRRTAIDAVHAAGIGRRRKAGTRTGARLLDHAGLCRGARPALASRAVLRRRGRASGHTAHDRQRGVRPSASGRRRRRPA